MADTIFHKIMNKEIPAQIVFEDDTVVAFRDIQPASPIHVLIVPRKAIPSMVEVLEADEPLLGHMLTVAAKIAQQESLDGSGYRLVVNTGPSAQQSVMQLHLHLLGGRDFTWPPG
jgi:histidine triad (HIT) family protein